MNAFGEPLHQTGDTDLIDHLRQLTRAGGAEQFAHASVRSDYLLGASIGLGIAAAHDGEDAVFGAGLTPRDGRVDESEAALRRLSVEFACDLSRSGGVIDEHGSTIETVESGIRAKSSLTQIDGIAYAAHVEILTVRLDPGRSHA